MKKLRVALSDALHFRTEIMGIAAIWVMLLHIFSELYPEIHIPLLHIVIERGNLGVDIFLLFSGIGLYFSQSKNSDVKQFYLKRMKRVVVPWIILSAPYWAIMTVINHESIPDFFINLFGLSFWIKGLATVWYVALIIILYLLYPLIFRIQQKYGTMAIICIIVFCLMGNILLLFAAPDYYEKVDLALARVPVFLIGSIWGKVCRDQKSENKLEMCWIVVYGAASVLCFLASSAVSHNSRSVGRLLYFLGGTGVGIFIIILLSIVFTKWKLSLFKSVFAFMGKMSLELYLLHVFVRNLTAKSGIGDGSSSMMKVVIMTGVFAVSVLLAYGYCKASLFFRKEEKKS